MGWFNDDKPEKRPSKPPKNPGEMTPEQLDKLLEGMKKKDPAEKDGKNPPKKSGWW